MNPANHHISCPGSAVKEQKRGGKVDVGESQEKGLGSPLGKATKKEKKTPNDPKKKRLRWKKDGNKVL